MATDFIKIIAVVLLVLTFLRIARGSLRIGSLYDVFFWVWLYYTLCVPFDLLSGSRIPTQGSYVDINDAASHPAVLQVLIQYLLCGASFFCMYKVLPTRHSINDRLDRWKRYQIFLPPFWFVASLIIGTCVIYIVIFGATNRQERALMAAADPSFKFFYIWFLLIQGLSIIYVIQTQSHKRALAMTLISFLFGFSSGSRSDIFIPALIYALRHEVTISRKQIMLFGAFLMLFLFLWKMIWSVIYFGYITSDTDIVVKSILEIATSKFLEEGFSVSQLEGMGPYSTSVMLGLYESPGNLLGKTYTWTCLQMLYPRFLQSSPVETLSEQYGAQFHPDFTAIGGGLGFSGMGEAWLNFGFMGPVIVGLLLGILLKYFDEKPRGIGVVLILFVIVRFFRSDAASIFKSYIVLFGGSFLLILTLLCLWSTANGLVRHVGRYTKRN